MKIGNISAYCSRSGNVRNPNNDHRNQFSIGFLKTKGKREQQHGHRDHSLRSPTSARFDSLSNQI
jgi:hypothetical protein